MTDPFPSRFIDGTTPSERYLAALAAVIDDACDAQENVSLDDLERAAADLRRRAALAQEKPG